MWEKHAHVTEKSEKWGEIFLKLGNQQAVKYSGKNSQILCVAGGKKGSGV